MKGVVIIDSCLLDKEDMSILNAQSENIRYSLVKSSGFISSAVILVLVDLARNIGYNVAYDILKNTILKIDTLVKSKKKPSPNLQFEISCNGSVFSLRGNKELSDKQMDKLVDAAVKVLLSEWESKERPDEQQ